MGSQVLLGPPQSHSFWAVLCPLVKDFIFLCETLPRLVLYGCSFTLFLCCQVLDWLVCFLAVILSEACFHFLALTLYPCLFCHLYLWPDRSFNLSIVFGSFWLASLFLQVSSLVTKIKDLRGNPGLSLPALVAKKFSCCVSYRLVGNHGVQISIFIYQCRKRCKSTIYSCLESTRHCWIIQLLEVKKKNGKGVVQSDLKKAEKSNGQFTDLFSKNEHTQVPLLHLTWMILLFLRTE